MKYIKNILIKGKRQYINKNSNYNEYDDEIKIGYRKKFVERPASQGVYDPVKNDWLQLPKDIKIQKGLSYSPNTKYSYR